MNSSSAAVAKTDTGPKVAYQKMSMCPVVKVEPKDLSAAFNAAGDLDGAFANLAADKPPPAVTPEPSVAGEGLSVDGFMQAVASKDKAAINVYRKVLSKSNKKMARKQDHSSRINPWNAHVAEFRKANPTMKFKEVLQQAKATYKK